MKGISGTATALVLGFVLALGGGTSEAPPAVAQDSKCGVGQIHNLSKSTIPVTVSDWPSGNGTRDRVDPGKYSSITVRGVYIPANYRLTYDGIVVVRPAGYNRWYTTPAVFWPVCSDIWIRR